MADLKGMQVGQIVDFCISFNERQEKAQKKQAETAKRGTRRKATQGDINAFFG